MGSLSAPRGTAVTVRFYLDEDLSPIIAALARRYGIDIVSSHELGRNGTTDEEQLRYAAQEGRAIVTENRGHFIALTFAFQEKRQPHAGVLLVPKTLPNDHFAAIAAAIMQYDRDHPG